MKFSPKYLFQIALPLITLSHSEWVYSAEISQVSGRQAVVSTGGEELGKGYEYYVLGKSGERKGLVRVVSSNTSEAQVIIVKGYAKPGFNLEPYQGECGEAPPPLQMAKSEPLPEPPQAMPEPELTPEPIVESKMEAPEPVEPPSKPWPKFWSLAAGYNMGNFAVNAQSADGITTKAVSLAGGTFLMKGFFDFQFSDYFLMHSGLGWSPVTVTGSSGDSPQVCGNNATCGISYGFTSFETHLYWLITNSSSLKSYLGLGAQLLMVNTVSTNIPNWITTDKYNTVLPLTLGLDFKTKNNFFPIYATYGTYRGSSTVTANNIAVGFGWGQKF